MFRTILFSVCVLTLTAAGQAEAQNFNWNYGEGIHKYFAGNSSESIQALDAAIAEKSNDPRPYYFRGLARMRCGDSCGAMADYQMASRIEALGKRRSPAVARALERVQGAERMQLEKVRTAAFRPSMIAHSYPSCPCGVIPCGCASNSSAPQNFALQLPTRNSQPVITISNQSVGAPVGVAAMAPQLSAPEVVAPPTASFSPVESTQTSATKAKQSSAKNPMAKASPSPRIKESDASPFGIGADSPATQSLTEAPAPQSPSEELFSELNSIDEAASESSTGK